MNKIEGYIKLMVDILLISIIYLFIRAYLANKIISIVVFINFTSTIFIQAIFIAIVIILIIKAIKHVARNKK